MPLAITQPPFQLEFSSWQVSKASVAAAGTIKGINVLTRYVGMSIENE